MRMIKNWYKWEWSQVNKDGQWYKREERFANQTEVELRESWFEEMVDVVESNTTLLDWSVESECDWGVEEW